MSKAVLLSIKPKYCELIANGKKTIELRKTLPKLETPFKVYIYETKALYKPNGCNHLFSGAGKVIGEFICDTIFPMWDGYAGNCGDDCLSFGEREEYLNGEMGYGFHISDLTIYDKPKDLDEFMAFGKSNCDCKNCNNCLYMGIDGVCDIKDIYQPLFRPPQSWCYVESEDSE